MAKLELDAVHAAWSETKNLKMSNDKVIVDTLKASDIEAFASVAYGQGTWRYFVQRVENPVDLEKFVADAVADTAAGKRAVFCIRDKATGAAIGSTAFGNFAPADRRVEIGWSWLGEAYRGRGYNRPTKFLMLQYAFERLGCERVEFKTDILNTGARRALTAIGATEEGVFRSYNFMPGGRRRDAVWYSILAGEWSVISTALAA